MKIKVYGVTNWDNKEQVDPNLKEWYERTNAYIKYDDIFLTTGTYSDPQYNPLPIPLIQNGLQKTRPYGKGWSYFRNGFVTGLWYCIFQDNCDILIHNQTRMLIGEDMNQHIEDFYNSDKLIMAPRFTNIACTAVEVGFLCMKREAVIKIVSQPLRPSLCETDDIMNNEDEIYYLFKDSWYDPFFNIRTTRKRDWNYPLESPFHLEMDEFLDLPIVSGGHHCSEDELNLWKEKHPIPHI